MKTITFHIAIPTGSNCDSQVVVSNTIEELFESLLESHYLEDISQEEGKEFIEENYEIEERTLQYKDELDLIQKSINLTYEGTDRGF